MSTRALIIISSIKEEKHLLMYHHFDGYPDGVGMALLEALKPLRIKAKNHECECWSADEIVNILSSGPIIHYKDGEGNTQEIQDNGFELTSSNHTDIDYWYRISCDKMEIICTKGSISTLYKVEIPEDKFTTI